MGVLVIVKGVACINLHFKNQWHASVTSWSRTTFSAVATYKATEATASVKICSLRKYLACRGVKVGISPERNHYSLLYVHFALVKIKCQLRAWQRVVPHKTH